MPRLDATKVAVGISSVLAVVGGVYGLYEHQFMWTAVAVVIYLLGQGELAAVQLQERRRRWRNERDEDDREDDWVKVVDVRPHASFSGWVWDARRQVWVEWQDGIPVREVRR
ncbi:hypothetical protein J0H58_07830 [bacterium]|nr:hypothetical protein [bacterium]